MDCAVVTPAAKTRFLKLLTNGLDQMVHRLQCTKFVYMCKNTDYVHDWAMCRKIYS